jgi:hypothetical protein
LIVPACKASQSAQRTSTTINDGDATGTLSCSLAVIAVASEATGPAIVLGGIAAWIIKRSA